MPPPPGFISFCLRFPDQCDAPADEPVEVALTFERWRAIERVNAAVNRAIWPEDDQRHYDRPEYWTIPSDGYGDCEDYALTKRRDLIVAGFPLRALRIAVATSTRYGRHAVLTVVTDRGDLVLDNLTDDIVERRQTPYVWIEQQDADDPRAWISLAEPPPGKGTVPKEPTRGPTDLFTSASEYCQNLEVCDCKQFVNFAKRQALFSSVCFALRQIQPIE